MNCQGRGQLQIWRFPDATYGQCETCNGQGVTAFNIRCATCNGAGYRYKRKEYVCPVCGGHFFLPRDDAQRVRCPQCGSLLVVYSESNIEVVERRNPIIPPQSKVVAGLVGGALTGSLVGPEGAVIGAIIGGLLGFFSQAPQEAREET